MAEDSFVLRLRGAPLRTNGCRSVRAEPVEARTDL